MPEHYNPAKTDGEIAFQLKVSCAAKRVVVAGDDDDPESWVAESKPLFRAGGRSLFWTLAVANVLALAFLISSVVCDGSVCAVKGTGRAVALLIATRIGSQ